MKSESYYDHAMIEEINEVVLDDDQESESENEISSVVTVDYSSKFEALQNSFHVNNALLLALILLLGLLKGFKHD